MNHLMKATAATALLALSSAASAEFSANVGLTSDYVFRGISQNDNEPAIQGGFDYDFGNGFSMGTWASNVDGVAFAGSTMELDLYAGYTWEFDGGLSVGLGYLRYQYPGTTVSANNTNEFSVSLGYEVSGVGLSASVAYSEDFFGFGKEYYTSIGIDAPITEDLSLSVALGFTTDDDTSVAGKGGDSYSDTSIGLSYSVGGFDLGLTYTSTGGTAKTNINGESIAFSVGRSF